jgi:hypothetical protein
VTPALKRLVEKLADEKYPSGKCYDDHIGFVMGATNSIILEAVRLDERISTLKAHGECYCMGNPTDACEPCMITNASEKRLAELLREE